MGRRWIIAAMWLGAVMLCGILAHQVQQYRMSVMSEGGAVVKVVDRPYSTVLEQKTMETLHDFGEWLEENKVKGYVGEMGWPGDETDMWEYIANRWYETAAYYDMWVTQWAAGSAWPGSYRLTIYEGDQERGLYQPTTQSHVLERAMHLYNTPNFGVNMAGMEFGDTANARHPGVAGTDYFYEPTDSFRYLASRGISLVRLPISWERIQPELSGSLNKTEIMQIKELLEAAQGNGIRIIIDLHNYGVYDDGNAVHTLGASEELDAAFVDVWERLSDELRGHGAVAGYGIMNEPHSLGAGRESTPAKHWEVLSQRVVDALRVDGDDRLVLVPGYDWSSMDRWRSTHPQAWIQDPADNIRYEAHHYWDFDASGKYIQTYEYELNRSEQLYRGRL